jgi:menaquinone-dependent protoporphyrinogen IX oxidase
MKFRQILFWMFLFAVVRSVSSQDVNSLLSKATELIENKQYATANIFLESAIQKAGSLPQLVCLQVENALENHLYHHKFNSFYMLDANVENPTGPKAVLPASVLRYPDRLLERIIVQNPKYAAAYKLLGDFYNLKLDGAVDSTLINREAMAETVDMVFQNYDKAVQLGYNDMIVNRWLGNYYKSKNQPKSAKEFYQKNIESGFRDVMTYYHLAEINYKEKQYSQSYSHILKVLSDLPVNRLNIRYKSLKIAAMSLYYLGEVERFKKYILECTRIFPDRQEAYLALLRYYDEKKDVDKMEETLSKMLTENPYELPGYNFLEVFVLKYKRYSFSEKLFENLMLIHENSDQVMGNIYWYRGNLVFHQGMHEEAKKMWEISRSYFRKYLPKDAPVLKKIGSINQKTYAN